MEELRDRVAVVTGGASGIGFGMLEAFAAEGMKLVLADIETEALETATAKLRDAGASVIGVHHRPYTERRARIRRDYPRGNASVLATLVGMALT